MILRQRHRASENRVGNARLRMAMAIRTLQTLSRHVTSFKWRNYAAISNLQVANDKKSVSVEFDGVEKHVYHAVWLKHFCHCTTCRDPSSGQTQHSPESLRGVYKLSSVVNNENSVQVTWEDDEDSNHKGTFPVDWLKDNAYGEEVLDKISREARPVPLTGKVSEFDYKRLTEGPSERLDWLLKIYEDGLSLLKNVPINSGYVTKVADFVYANRPAIFGDYFDVVTKATTDVSYSQNPITLHSDELYYESPPGLTLLHCLKFDECVEGGYNVMVDQFAAAEDFRREHREYFDTLAKVPIIIQRVSPHLQRPVHMRYYRPHIVLGYNDEIIAVNWTNHTQYGVCAPHDMVEPYYQARNRWYNFVKNYRIRHIIRLMPGDLLIVNNRRVLHSRTDFSLNGGERHLQGSYVNIDEFKG